MKKYLIPTTAFAASLMFTSCGSKEEVTNADSQTASTQEEAQVSASHDTVKKAIKSQVNSTTSDLMLKVPNFIDLQPVQYDMPESLEGRELVQVTTKWPMVAKYDLYLTDSHLLDHPDKPIVVEKIHDKGDQLEYVELTFVLESDGGGGFIQQNTRFTKQSFSFGPGLDKKENLGKNLLEKGSDEHLLAGKVAAEVKQKREEQERIAKAETDAKAKAAAELKIAELLPVLKKSGKFRGELASGNYVADIGLKAVSITEIAGERIVTINMWSIDARGRSKKPASFEGKFNESGSLILNRVKIGQSYEGPKFFSYHDMRSDVTISWAGHIDKIQVDVVDSRKNVFKGTFLRN